MNKMHPVETAPTTKMHSIGTVPTNKMYLVGTLIPSEVVGGQNYFLAFRDFFMIPRINVDPQIEKCVNY